MYKVNTKYFSTIDSEDKAYWVGFIMADGYIYKDLYVRVELSSIDKEHLEKFSESIESNIPIKTTVRKDVYIGDRKLNASPSCVFTISRKKVVKDLINIGVPNKDKTLTDVVPNIPKEFKRDFVRGYFDGDGCVSNRKTPEAYVLGLPSLLSYIVSDLNVNNKLYKDSIAEIPLHKLRWFSKKDLKSFYEYIYYKENITCLQRKQEVFKQIVL